jgi:hypothetical protein
MKLRQILAIMPIVAVLVVAAPVTPSGAEDAMKKLEIFSDAPLEKGLWRMEVLESSDPSIKESSAKMGKASICMDVAREIAAGPEGEDETEGDEDPDCKQEIVRDTASAGEIAVTCKDGDKTTVIITREGPKAYVFDSKRTSPEGEAETMKGRYTYQGPCKGDSLIQMDRDSEACQKMRAQMGEDGGTAMCAQVPEEHRAECVKRIQSLTAMCE